MRKRPVIRVGDWVRFKHLGGKLSKDIYKVTSLRYSSSDIRKTRGNMVSSEGYTWVQVIRIGEGGKGPKQWYRRISLWKVPNKPVEKKHCKIRAGGIGRSTGTPTTYMS